MNVATTGGACLAASSCGDAVAERDANTVAALRDTQLTKLISGELRVDSLKKTARDDGQRELLGGARTPS